MENTPRSNQLPFQTARARLASRYGLSLDTDDYIERAYYVWRDIGNIALAQRTFDVIVPADGIVTLPSDCEFIESAVTRDVIPGTPRNTTDGKYDMNSGGYRHDVRPDKEVTSAEDSVRASTNYSYGITVNFEIGDGYIHVTSSTMANRPITIRYSAISVGTDGLPLLNDKEVNAIAGNLALQEAERELFKGIKGAEIKVQYLKQESDRLFQAAKTPERINDNELDKVLDIKVSWDRKVYGRRYNTTF